VEKTTPRRPTRHTSTSTASCGRASAHADSARNLIQSLFFSTKRYDMAKVGRHKVLKKLRHEYGSLPLDRLGIEARNGDPDRDESTLSKADILATVSYLVKLNNKDTGYFPDTSTTSATGGPLGRRG